MTIQEIREKMQQQNYIAAKVEEFRKRQRTLQESESSLRAVWQKEEADVNRLEAGSLAGLWYAMTGRKEQMLDKEKQEAYGAAVKHKTVLGELEAVTQELDTLMLQKCSVGELERQLELAIQERIQWLKANCPDKEQDILQAEEEIAELSSQIRELDEAVSAGKRAEQIAGEVKKSLDSAEGWGTWDMLGGGMVATMAKHSHLDTAQRQINELQTCLARFRTELADVSLEANMQVQVDGFLRFADYFWDGLFADWAVQSKIGQSQEQVRQVQEQIRSLLAKLQTMEQDAQRKLRQRKAWMEECAGLAEHDLADNRLEE